MKDNHNGYYLIALALCLVNKIFYTIWDADYFDNIILDILNWVLFAIGIICLIIGVFKSSEKF